MLAGSQEENRETPLHLLLQCDSVENVVLSVMSDLIDNEGDFMAYNRSTYFSVPSYDNTAKNTVILVYQSLLKKYIWDCKLRKTLPNVPNAKNYCRQTISVATRCSKFFRLNVENSGLNLN